MQTTDETRMVECEIEGHVVKVGKLSTGVYTVGVDGTLVGNYWTAGRAVAEAAERVRQLEGWGRATPKMPDDARRKIAAL